jgi:23S rRNA (cytidine1920-2'-O)/16S rRNA (cytidine1409-2'-O)-methyltransferase
MSKKVRLDRLLVQRGLAPSRQRAQELIEQGVVLVDGIVATKPATQVDVARPVRLEEPDHGWVGRGALKLLGAIEAFGVDPAKAVCADLGASTGGFTEVLLRGGAARVYAIDVGRGLLHRRLEVDPKVVVMDGVNARYLYLEGEPSGLEEGQEGTALPERCDLVVGDLSFIGLEHVLDAVLRILKPDGEAVLLVKPQFEVGRGQLGSKGKVTDDAVRAAAIERVRATAEGGGLQVLGGVDSTVPGARSGTVEHFLWLRRRP